MISYCRQLAEIVIISHFLCQLTQIPLGESVIESFIDYILISGILINRIAWVFGPQN